MKKIISLLVALTMLSALLACFSFNASAEGVADKWDGTVGSGFDGGTGTEANPYLIGSGKTLAYLATTVNSSKGETNAFSGKYFKMTNSIDLDNKTWTPIGYLSEGAQATSCYFGGIFDGAGYCIYNLNVTTYRGADSYANVLNCGVGLFGVVQTDTGVIKNLGIESGTVTCTGGMAGGVVGILAGKASVSNCYSKATVKANCSFSGNTSWAKIGGIVGQCKWQNTISDCVSYATLSTAGTGGWSGEGAVGGICGDVAWNKDANVISATIKNCYFDGNVYSANQKCGGILGTQRNAIVTVENCHAGGTVAGNNSGVRGYFIGYYSEGGTYSYSNSKVYTGKYTSDKVKYDEKELACATAVVGSTDGDGTTALTEKIEIVSSELNIPCAQYENFVIQTEHGEELVKLAKTVREGTAQIDGVLDEAYLSSCRMLDYTSRKNALSEAEWSGADADIYVMADYEYIYIAACVKDKNMTSTGDAIDGIDFSLSFDGGKSVFTVCVKIDGSVTLGGTTNISVGDIKSAVKTGENTYTAELAVPVGTVFRYGSLGIGVTVNDVTESGTLKFSEVESGCVIQYPIGVIHGRPGVSVTGVTLEEKEIDLILGQSVVLSANITPVDSYDRSLTWESSAPNVAIVDENGKVTASTVGEAIITVTTSDGQFKDTCKVTVSAIAVKGISISTEELTLSVGRRKMLTCTVTPSDAENKEVIWSSSNPDVVTVSENGLVTAQRSGSAIVTVTTVDGGFTATCKVYAVSHLTDLKIENENYLLKVGETQQIGLILTPEDANDSTWTWSSDNEAVCTVDENGLITGIGEGTATVTLRTANGMIEKSCTVNVTAAVDDVNGDNKDASDTNGESKSGCSSSVAVPFTVFGVIMIAVATFIGKEKKNEP